MERPVSVVLPPWARAPMPIPVSLCGLCRDPCSPRQAARGCCLVAGARDAGPHGISLLPLNGIDNMKPALWDEG